MILRGKSERPEEAVGYQVPETVTETITVDVATSPKRRPKFA